MWDRLENLVRSLIDADERNDGEIDDAWRELEEYLRRSDEFVGPDEERRSRGTSGNPEIPQPVRQALYDLEVKADPEPEQLRRAYRRLLRRYHPDRFHNDTEQAERASEVIHRLSLAYKRVKDYYRY